ncbi:hypothetical protein [Laspinema olomoucense]|uniref:hypothetical protein n=1 Tax=Laspinema olomoucense TaxID=3231600 RepID=UPI0021BA9460|nr:hypothetical protein [Laspinema sp. D3d]MCT7974805.1 hypothetical protein [Laspinema sp. D3d]
MLPQLSLNDALNALWCSCLEQPPAQSSILLRRRSAVLLHQTLCDRAWNVAIEI